MQLLIAIAESELGINEWCRIQTYEIPIISSVVKQRNLCIRLVYSARVAQDNALVKTRRGKVQFSIVCTVRWVKVTDNQLCIGPMVSVGMVARLGQIRLRSLLNLRICLPIDRIYLKVVKVR